MAFIKEEVMGGRLETGIVKKFRVPLSVLSTVLWNMEKVRGRFEQALSSKRRRCRDSKFPYVEAFCCFGYRMQELPVFQFPDPPLLDKATLALQMATCTSNAVRGNLSASGSKASLL